MIRRYEDERLKSSRGTFGRPRGFLGVAALILAFGVALPAVFALPTAAPRAISLNMRTETYNGLKWVRSTTEISAVFPIPLEAYKTVLLDAASYPGYVPHLASVELFTSPSGKPAMRQRFVVKILGFTFQSIFATTIEPDDSLLPGRWRLAWNFVDSDGTVSRTSGYWELEDVSEDGESRVRVYHYNDGLVKKKYPFQTTVMRMVGERELSASLLTGYHEALRRWPDLKTAAAKNGAVEELPAYRKADGAAD